MRGPGFFKLNTSLLLQKDYVEKIRKLITDKTAEYNNQGVQPDLLWETLKAEIRGETIKYSSMKKKQRENKAVEIEKEIDILEKVYDIYKSVECANRIDLLKTELQNIYNEKCNGISTRAKVRWLKEGEKNTKYFIGLEKRNYINKTIIHLINNEGDQVNKFEDILNEQKRFYSNLYSEKEVELDNIELQKIFFVESDNISKLTETHKEMCEGLITKEECLIALKTMQNFKSPGTDGFPAEFYKIFWHSVSDILINSFNYSYDKYELSISQKQGIITLLPKSDRDIRLLKNWRPISLLNTDYKILTKCLANRLKKVLPVLIHTNQTGFLKNRYIGSNIRLLLDLIDYTQETNQAGMIFSIDFEKAFDTVNWKFLNKCLEYFNFGVSFKNWIKIIQSGACSCIVNNGWSTGFFNLGQGVRQGCPLSPYLFLLCSEIFGIGIRNSKNIKGLKIKEVISKLIQFADDTQIILDGTKSSLDGSINILQTFERLSGLKVNFDKSEIVKLGSTKNDNLNIDNGIKITKDYLKVLGIKIPINNKVEDLIKLNYEPVLGKIKSIIKTWSRRTLTYFGKATIIKTLILPQIIYQLTNLPSPPDAYLKDIDNLIFEFLWDKKRPKIKKSQLYLEHSHGGLKIPNIYAFSQSLKLRWIKALVDIEEVSDWKSIFLDRFSPVAKFLVMSNISAKDVLSLGIKNPFWVEVITIWAKIHYNKLRNINYNSSTSATIIWFNSNIKVKGKFLFYEDWYKKGIVYIKELINQNTNRFLTYEEFINKFHINTTFLKFYGVIVAIQNYFENSGEETYEDCKINKLMQAKSCSKAFYNEILKQMNKHTPRKCFENWNKQFGKNIDWEEAFQRIFRYTNDTKLRNFQFKLLHNIFPSNKLLKKLGILDNDKCDFCGIHRDSVQHYLWDCDMSQTLWKEIEELIKSIYHLNIDLSFETILLGKTFIREYHVNTSINFLILLTKFYIHCSKWTKKKPSLTSYIEILKQRERVEKQLAFETQKVEKHNDKWTKIKETLNF